MTRAGQAVDEALMKNVQYCATDMFLGRGTTDKIVQVSVVGFGLFSLPLLFCCYSFLSPTNPPPPKKTCIKKDGVDNRSVWRRAGDCGTGAAHVAKAIAVDLPVMIAGGISNCAQKVVGRKEGSCAADIGNAAKKAGAAAWNWGATTTSMAVNGVSGWYARRKHCASSQAAKAQCVAEDKRASENSSKAWAKFRENHAVYRGAYNAAQATSSAVKGTYQTCIKNGASDNRTVLQRAGACGAGAVQVGTQVVTATARVAANTYTAASRAVTTSTTYQTCVKKAQGVDSRTALQRARDCGSGALSAVANTSRAVTSAVANTSRAVTSRVGQAWTSATKSSYNPLNWFSKKQNDK